MRLRNTNQPPGPYSGEDDLNLMMMAKSKNGFVPPKGKPTGSEKDTHHLKDAFAAADPETENEIAAEYTKDGADEIADGVRIRHVNRNLHKGEDIDESGNIINS